MNLPNKLTLGRLILIPVFVLFFYLDFTGHYLVSLGIFAVAAFTDFLDGYIARKYNLVTDLGKFLDPIADKVLVLVALVVMLADPKYTNLFFQHGSIGFILGGIGVSIIIAREMAVSSLRMLAAKNGTVLAADKLGKIKTFFTDVTIIVLLFSGDFLTIAKDFGKVVNVIGLVCFGISVLLTVVSGVSYLVKNKEVFKE
ncbi:MAG: CDP-diacylglycerol--glycerol-3-phosphate 3-phosphatidyltransferase [Clostridiales bacterium]|nr:CDP-diacylglycerol--glycerol-3-phosphate 3-phosphatidyltransferase [Clostridiales bacterium]